MRLSVVMVARDAAGTIGRQLEALNRQRFEEPWEIVVVDDGSRDDTAAVVEAHREVLPDLRVVARREARGVNAARNAGVASTRGRHVLLCDPADQVADGWIAAMDRGLLVHDLVGGPVDERTLNGPDDVFNPRHEMRDNPTVPGFLHYPLAGNCGIRRETWEAMGGFAEDWRRGVEHVELFLRAQLAGATLGFVPEALVAQHLPPLRDQRRNLLVAAAGHARLYARFADAGMPPRSAPAILRSWLWLLLRLPWLVHPDPRRRRKWQKFFAWYAGRLLGSLRWRVVYL